MVKTSKESFRLSDRTNKERKIMEYLEKVDASRKSLFIKDALSEYIELIEKKMVISPYLEESLQFNMFEFPNAQIDKEDKEDDFDEMFYIEER